MQNILPKSSSSPSTSTLLFIVIIAILFFLSSISVSAQDQQESSQQQQQQQRTKESTLVIENDQDVLKNAETDIIKTSQSFSEQELSIADMASPSSATTIARKQPFFRGDPFRLERGPWTGVPNPFMFCVYHKDRFPKGYKGTQGADPAHKKGRQMGSDFSYKDGFSYYHGGQGADELIPGFPSHPHRGLSTITITLNNSSPVDHFDSTGAHGRYGGGDIQWMSAGAGADGKSGIQHSEMFPLINEDKENVLELFQVWIRLPLRSVNTEPGYKMFWNEEVPVAKIPVEGKPSDVFSEVKVVVGDYPWNLPFKPPSPPQSDYAADPESQATIYVAQLPCTGAKIKLPAMRTATAERSIFVYIADDEENAKIKIEPITTNNNEAESELMKGGSIRFRHGIKIAPDVEVSITNEGSGGNIGILVLAGEPLKEPVVSYGPFVGKDMGVIEEAFASYRRTQFGGWPWPSNSPVHKITDPRISVPGKGKDVEYPPGYTPSK